MTFFSADASKPTILTVLVIVFVLKCTVASKPDTEDIFTYTYNDENDDDLVTKYDIELLLNQTERLRLFLKYSTINDVQNFYELTNEDAYWLSHAKKLESMGRKLKYSNSSLDLLVNIYKYNKKYILHLDHLQNYSLRSSNLGFLNNEKLLQRIEIFNNLHYMLRLFQLEIEDVIFYYIDDEDEIVRIKAKPDFTYQMTLIKIPNYGDFGQMKDSDLMFVDHLRRYFDTVIWCLLSRLRSTTN